MNATAIQSRVARSVELDDESRGGETQAARIVADLWRWFGAEFELINGSTGEILRRASCQPMGDSAVRGSLCREVVRRGSVEIIEDEDPFVVLAIPVPGEHSLVAVATFLMRAQSSDDDMERAARLLNLAAPDAAAWMSRQIVWKTDALMRLAELAVAKFESERWAASLEKEVEDLSYHLSTTYEEISLLYRLTQNLKLSSKDDELGRLAIEWLADAVPAESIALQLLPVTDLNVVNAQARTTPLLLTHGDRVINEVELKQLIDDLELNERPRPLVVDRSITENTSWRYPSIREMVIVPLIEGNNLFGWLLVFNHTGDGEFGSVEASLLSSVGVILGIHCGNADLYRRQAEFFAGVVRALTSAIDAKDPYTCGHSDRVARIAVRLAKEMGLKGKQLNTIYLSGLLHDIGKIGIDDNVLRKPGKLTDAEYEHIKAHTEIGYRILVDLKQLDEVLPVVLHHHEQWNGKGYPQALSGEQIPLMARIVAVADAFDAMRSDRPYRRGLPDDKVEAILRDGASSQWDAHVVDAFFRARDDIRALFHQEKGSSMPEIQWT